jgi:membrane associated rhomboid family serine protease
MIPLYDDRTRRRFPWMTVSIVLLNVVVFGYELSLASSAALDAFITRYAFVPARLLSDPYSLAQLGTILSSMFLHGGFAHIGFNMLYLWIFGDNVEDRLGPLRFLAFYVFCGVAAVVAQTLGDVSSTIPTLGASGAIAGVLGAYLVLYPRARVRTLLIIIIIPELIDLPAALLIGIWFLLQVASGVGSLGQTAAGSGGVAYLAHVGGFLAGAVLALPLRWADRKTASFGGWQ